uniref:DUF973 family protein n=1 Tax=Ignisphaera aggregans TaxID=334771 RepID=A0A7J3I7P1_9CREN
MSISENIRNLALKGIEDFRKGSLAMIIANGLSLTATVLIIVFVFPYLSVLPLGTVMRRAAPSIDLLKSLDILGSLITVAAIMGVFGIVSLILTVYAIYIKFIPGSNKLKKWREDFSTPSTLMKIGYIGGLILIIFGIGIMIVLAITLLPTIGGRGTFSNPMDFLRFLAPLFGGLAIILIGGLLWLVGNIGLILLFLRFHSVFNEVPLLIAAILFILLIIMGLMAALPLIGIFIAIVTAILTLTAWILSYIGLGNVIKKVQSQTTQLVLV